MEVHHHPDLHHKPIPAGALASDLAITIQPITNECPNGVGIAYDFLPNGTKFLTPATLTFHYTDDDLDGTDPYFSGRAFHAMVKVQPQAKISALDGHKF